MATSILEYIFNNCEFTETGLVTPDDADKQTIHRFLRESILDAHLPVVKAVGFSLNASSTLHRQVATERCSYCLENMIEISSNLDDLVFLEVYNTRVTSDFELGEVSLPNSVLTSNAKPIHVLYTNPHLLTNIKPLKLEIFVTENTGYKTMKDNSKIMGKNKYFPMNTYHNIISYVKILPFNGDIRYRLTNGMTLEALKSLYVNYYAKYIGKQLGKEEIGWASVFVQ
jgi:hypothetical protein